MTPVSYRTRLLMGFAAVALVPLLALGLGVRHVMTGRLTRQFEARVESLAGRIETDLRGADLEVSRQLHALGGQLAGDNRIRLATVRPAGSERSYLLDWAQGAMGLVGLSMLQLQDESGRIVSSGHFRHEFDRLEPRLPELLLTTDGPAVVEARSPDGPFLALARSQRVSLAGRTFWLIGGRAMDDAFLAALTPGGGGLHVSFERSGEGGRANPFPGPSTARAVRLVPVSLIAPGPDGTLRVDDARIVVSQDLQEIVALRASVDRWFLLVLVGTALSVLFVASWLSTLISGPLVELANKTSRVDLERLDVRFERGGVDEVSRLSSVLGGLTERLRSSVERLREAERHAAVGELARQVNHDIKNGLTPIRNVVRHLSGIEKGDAERLASVFRERQGTLESSIAYLETLAAGYARLSPPTVQGTSVPNTVVREVVAGARAGAEAGVVLTSRLAPGLPEVRADPMVLRRILENLVSNALEAARQGGGRAVVSTTRETGPAGELVVRVSVTDDGPGMTEAEVQRAFEDFYTTKEDGTGLGLSVVRRLVMDLHGRVDVDSAPGRGTTFAVDLPVSRRPRAGDEAATDGGAEIAGEGRRGA